MLTRTLMRSLVVSLGLAGGTFASDGKPALTIVSNGQPAAVITIGEDPGPELRHAASELRDYIEKISGARLGVATEGQPAIDIAVDPSLHPRLGEDGFVIRIDPTAVQLHGATGIAAVYAVYAFLEEQLGCRWFFPIELGEEIPRQPTITLNRLDRPYKPDFRFRHIGGVQNLGWNAKNRLSEDLIIGKRTYNKVWGVAHTFYRLLPMEEYWEAHPEYYSFNRGRRSPPIKLKSHGPNICTSNPDAIREVARRINNMFDDDPRLAMITVGPNDGLQFFCECPACQVLDEPGKEWRGPTNRSQWRGQLSRRLMIFYNQVGRLVRDKHPDRLIKIMVYSWYQEPPTDKDLKFEDNVLVMLTHSGNPSNYEKLYPSCYNHPLTDPRCRPNQERFVPALTGWCERSKRMGIYEYYCKASVCETAFPIVHTIREDLPFYRSHGVEYFFTQGNWRNASVIGLNYYVTAKLLWDVTTDVDALLSDFYTRFYREAARPMQQFHECTEEAMAKRGEDVLGWLFHLPKVYDEPTVDRLETLLDEADRLAETDRVRQRIAWARASLEYTLLAKSLWAKLENEHRTLPADTKNRASVLSQRVKPCQEALLRCMENNDSLRWLAKHRNNYLERLIGPEIGALYPTLLPAGDEPTQ